MSNEVENRIGFQKSYKGESIHKDTSFRRFCCWIDTKIYGFVKTDWSSPIQNSRQFQRFLCLRQLDVPFPSAHLDSKPVLQSHNTVDLSFGRKINIFNNLTNIVCKGCMNKSFDFLLQRVLNSYFIVYSEKIGMTLYCNNIYQQLHWSGL